MTHASWLKAIRNGDPIAIDAVWDGWRGLCAYAGLSPMESISAAEAFFAGGICGEAAVTIGRLNEIER